MLRLPQTVADSADCGADLMVFRGFPHVVADSAAPVFSGFPLNPRFPRVLISDEDRNWTPSGSYI